MKFLKTSLAVATLTLASSTVFAAGAVDPASSGNPLWNSGNHLMSLGGTLTASGISASINGFADNPALGNAAWAHAGNKWFTFMVHNTATTTVSVVSDVLSDMAPGFTVWRTDGEFDGGTGGTGEVPNVGSGPQQTPHSFNQVGAAGDNGTIWMTDDSLGGASAQGILETMGYANSGDASGTTAWNGNLQIGAFDGAGNASGSVGQGVATLELANLAAGWYAIYIGGADGALAGSTMTMTVSQVPVPAAVYLFGSALVGLFASGRRKLAA